MGRSETAEVSIGISILLKDLIEQINDNNIEIITELLQEGVINDSYQTYNDSYFFIIGNNFPENSEQCKEYLLNEFEKSKLVTGSNLLEETLLIPMSRIISTERHGYFCDGTNASAIPLEDVDFSFETNKIKCLQNLEKFKKVVIITQRIC
jgi:hypothetical protein